MTLRVAFSGEASAGVVEDDAPIEGVLAAHGGEAAAFVDTQFYVTVLNFGRSFNRVVEHIHEKSAQIFDPYAYILTHRDLGVEANAERFRARGGVGDYGVEHNITSKNSCPGPLILFVPVGKSSSKLLAVARFLH